MRFYRIEVTSPKDGLIINYQEAADESTVLICASSNGVSVMGITRITSHADLHHITDLIHHAYNQFFALKRNTTLPFAEDPITVVEARQYVSIDQPIRVQFRRLSDGRIVEVESAR